MKFKEWLSKFELNEMMGSVGAIVSCKDLNHPNFQIQGALSNLKCKKKKIPKVQMMKFNNKSSLS